MEGDRHDTMYIYRILPQYGHSARIEYWQPGIDDVPEDPTPLYVEVGELSPTTPRHIDQPLHSVTASQLELQEYVSNIPLSSRTCMMRQLKLCHFDIPRFYDGHESGQRKPEIR